MKTVAERIRSILEAGGLGRRRTISGRACAVLGTLAALLIAFAFRGPLDPWRGMTVAMGLLLAASLAVREVRERCVPSARGAGAGLAGGALLYGATRLVLWGVGGVWPGWTQYARALQAWKEPHSTGFLLATLVLIVAAEECLWRGVVVRYAAERLGLAAGVTAGAALYAAAHAAALNPLLCVAAFGCGLFWGALYVLTDGLAAPFVCHLLWDAMILFVLPVV